MTFVIGCNAVLLINILKHKDSSFLAAPRSVGKLPPPNQFAASPPRLPTSKEIESGSIQRMEAIFTKDDEAS